MGMRPVGRDSIGVPSQVAPSGRYVEGGASHHTLRALAGACVWLCKVVPYGHCRTAAFDRGVLRYLGFATPPTALESFLRYWNEYSKEASISAPLLF